MKITATSSDVAYSVCYCPGNCFSPSSWEKVPGTFSVAKSGFSWSGPAEVPRKAMGAPGSVSLHVSRPAFGSFSDAKGWELKLVSEYYDCGKAMDDTMFGCTATTTDPDDTLGPMLVSTASSNGYYSLQFNEPVTIDGCTGEFTFTDSTGSNTIPCGRLNSTSGSPRSRS